MELKSIAFIPDGNRRFARKTHTSLLTAYKKGTQKAWEVLHWLNNYPKIKFGTFYTLSSENLKRKRIELKILFKIFERELDKVWSSSVFTANEIKLNFIGKLELLPKKLQEKMRKAEDFTSSFKKKTINLAIGYDGQTEIVDAAKKIATAFKENKIDLNSLNHKTFYKYLYADFPEPDLIIRTSGTQRLSGFLTYQSSYSELYFLEKYWPEFTKQDLDNAIQEFYERQRRFGK
jgi:undecaprenyl diphosphate synthase